MHHSQNQMIKEMEDIYDELTPVEKRIADYFIQNRDASDYSAKSIAYKLYVSEASLTRFAKKNGYNGFREFIYNLKLAASEGTPNINEMIEKAAATYQHILNKSWLLVNEKQMENLSKSISNSQRILIYGMGSSGMAAQEFKLRLMRLGLLVDAVTDSHLMKISSALVNENCLIIALSISGSTSEVLTGIKIAKKHGAYVVLLTAANGSALLNSYCNEIIPVASTKNLEGGTLISPQFPLLVMLDVFYSYYIRTDYVAKSSIHTETLSALKTNEIENMNPYL